MFYPKKMAQTAPEWVPKNITLFRHGTTARAPERQLGVTQLLGLVEILRV